jgi:phage tail-like protein
MAQFSVNATRLDPYKNFKFRVKWDGRYVAGVSKVGALKRTIEVVKHRSGGDPSTSHKSPGKIEFEAITMERGVTHDIEFEAWANKAMSVQNGMLTSAGYRKNILIEVYNESNQKVMAYQVFRAWPSEFQAMADLDANGNAVLIQTLKLENEGWTRDLSVGEPTEPSFDDPAA